MLQGAFSLAGLLLVAAAAPLCAQTEGESIQALDDLYARIERGESPESAAESLAKGLKDERVPVQKHAIQLLGRCGLPEVAAPALLASCRRWVREEKELRERLEDLHLDTSSGGFTSGNRRESRHSANELQRALKEARRLEKDLERSQGLFELRADYSAAFAALRHDASVTGLGLLLDGRPPGTACDAAVDGLFELGTAATLEPLVGVLESWEDWQKEQARRERELRAMKPSDSEGDGRTRNNVPVDALLAKLQEEGTRAQVWIEGFHERMRAFALAHGLPPVPEELDSRDWKSWRREADDLLPRSVDP